MAPRNAPGIDESPDESPIGVLAPDRLDVAPLTIAALTPAESIQLSEMTISPIDVPPLAPDGNARD
jgi:hypothetical protein